MAFRAILSKFFEEQRTQNHPQDLSGLSRVLFPTTFLEIAVCCRSLRPRAVLALRENNYIYLGAKQQAQTVSQINE